MRFVIHVLRAGRKRKRLGGWEEWEEWEDAGVSDCRSAGGPGSYETFVHVHESFVDSPFPSSFLKLWFLACQPIAVHLT
jgi:hypothetical protein